MKLYLLMYLARLAKKLFSSSSFHFSCLGHHNPNCMTYVPPTLNVLFSCTSPSSPHRRCSRFLRDRNYAINYSAPYLSFLSHPFFVFFSNYCRRYSTRPQSQIWEIIKKCTDTYFNRDAAKSPATRENYFFFL